MCVSFVLVYFFLVGDKISAERFRDEITTFLKANDWHNFSQDVTLNHVREKIKPRCKLSYKVLKK